MRQAGMLEALFKPASIAVIGASRTPGKVGYAIVKNILDSGFEGQVVPVNPSAGEVLGLKCYKDLSEYGSAVDLGIITVPVRAVEDAARSLAANGARVAIVITAGFKEIGEEGAGLERRIALMLRESGVRMLGPNVVGFINTHHKLNASFALSVPDKGNVSVITQSGAVCTVLIDWAKGNRFGLGKLISIGNKADLSEVDLLPALAEDPDTKVIAGYLEDINAGNEFIKAAVSACERKPVIFMKAGTTKAGKQAASSHTGSLAGADTAYAAAFRRSGVIRADTFEQLLDYSMAFSMQPLPAGGRVAVITNAGGLGIMAADAVENAGLSMARLSAATDAELRSYLSKAANFANPVDMLGDSTPEVYGRTIAAILADPGVDAAAILFAPQAMSDPLSTSHAVVRACGGGKPVTAAFMGEFAVKEARGVLSVGGVPQYPSAERAVAALKAMAGYSAWKNRPPRIVARFPVNRRRVERVISRYLRTGRREVGEVDAKQILKAYDFTVPEGGVAATVEEAVAVTERLGFPVAMKVWSPDIIHKSDLGGVRVNLGSPDAVRDAFELMMLRIGRRSPHARLDGVYVERMAPPGREVIIGMSRDRQFGPMLMFGLGGIFVEVMKDVTFNLAPITAEEAVQMLQSTKSYALLAGARGQAAVDMGQIADGLQRISQLVTDFPEIAELDINPFIVGRVGSGASVADARMTLSGGDGQ